MMKKTWVVIMIGFVCLLSVSCGDRSETDDGPEAVEAAVAEQTPEQQDLTTEASPAPEATPFGGQIPTPIVVTATPVSTPTVIPTITEAVAAGYVQPPADSGVLHCGNFDNREAAQQIFLLEGYAGMDTNNDGIACNSATDDGVLLVSWAVLPPEPSPTPVASPVAPVAPTPTAPQPPAIPPEEVWENPDRTHEINSIPWQDFTPHVWGGQVRVISEGELVPTSWRRPDGYDYWAHVECGPRFGNRLDDDNPTYVETHWQVWIWIEPQGDQGFCAIVDRFRGWKLTDEPPPRVITGAARAFLPHGQRDEAMTFRRQPDGSWNEFYTLTPRGWNDIPLGAKWSFFGEEFTCDPHNLPLAVWTENRGFEPIGRDEEELLARESLSFYQYRADSTLYDWEQKEYWRGIGWYLVLVGWNYKVLKADYELNDVAYDLRSDQLTCWFVHNKEVLPPPRYCLECERRATMDLELRSDE